MPVLSTRMSSGLSKCSKSAQQGFTLIEMMVVIAIIAIMALIALPNLERSIQGQRVNQDTQTLMAALRDARTESQLLQKNVTLSYNDTSKTVALTTPAIGSSNDDVTLRLYNLNKKSGITASDDVVFRANKTTDKAITFDIYCDAYKIKKKHQVNVDVNGNVSINGVGTLC